MSQVPDLKAQFFCYERPNPHGFFGELRDMVRYDMTVGEAITFHVKNWNFEEDMNAKKLHEFSHQPFAVGTIYVPELQRYRIQTNLRTSLLKPQGYNGFMEGELIAIAIQTTIERMLEEEGISNWEAELKFGVKRALYSYGDLLKQNDGHFWVDSSYTEQKQSLFEAKFKKQFMLRPRSTPLRESDFQRPNIHGETLRRYTEPSDEELKAIASRMNKFFNFVANSFKDNNIQKKYQAAEFLYNLKIRDLHLLIGGEKAANKYFQMCGVALSQPYQTPRFAA